MDGLALTGVILGSLGLLSGGLGCFVSFQAFTRSGAAWEDWQKWSATEKASILAEQRAYYQDRISAVDSRLDEANAKAKRVDGQIGRLKQQLRDGGGDDEASHAPNGVVLPGIAGAPTGGPLQSPVSHPVFRVPSGRQLR